LGVETAKTLAFFLNKKLIPVNHLVGHVYANWLEKDEAPTFPNISLVVSGGHTEIYLMEGHGKFTRLGGTRDDAAGEAFDKVARLLRLPYPGGPSIQKTADLSRKADFNLPRPMLDSQDFDFSFSGLKTAVATLIEKEKIKDKDVPALAASFQESVVDTLVTKTVKAAKKHGVRKLLLSGGVAANQRLRDRLEAEFPTGFYVASPELSVDNGAMIASAGFFNFEPKNWRKVFSEPGLLP
jgi:N6-L-threonylcarbamoyladenine synthase